MQVQSAPLPPMCARACIHRRKKNAERRQNIKANNKNGFFKKKISTTNEREKGPEKPNRVVLEEAGRGHWCAVNPFNSLLLCTTHSPTMAQTCNGHTWRKNNDVQGFRAPESKSESALLIKGTVQSSSSRWRHRKSACLHQSHHFHVLREEWRRSWREAGRDATRSQRLPLVFKEAGSDVAADQCRPFCREPLKAVGVLDLL